MKKLLILIIIALSVCPAIALDLSQEYNHLILTQERIKYTEENLTDVEDELRYYNNQLNSVINEIKAVSKNRQAANFFSLSTIPSLSSMARSSAYESSSNLEILKREGRRLLDKVNILEGKKARLSAKLEREISEYEERLSVYNRELKKQNG